MSFAPSTDIFKSSETIFYRTIFNRVQSKNVYQLLEVPTVGGQLGVQLRLQVSRQLGYQESDAAKLQTSLQKLTLGHNLIPDELKSVIYRSIDIEDDSSRVLKVRRFDNNLIPMSTLLNGSSSEKPFIIDVVGVHQFCPVESRTILPSYIDAIQSKFTDLENRVKSAETSLPNLNDKYVKSIEDAATELSTCLHFLDRRLDELIPNSWQSQLNSSA
ncbi:uncharacterized protein LOC103570291 isoform X2 [Microplitis demolitor]|uniref:uncharacterized protein LOC103570291 isoform X2 n=1 Tax=Microplitis demolitor TaxID=69319 RepID=UPI00235B5F77|nr:uncharacterized protein LOC103570291 isoform X2 [Microplitis demolitor]